MPFIFPCLLDCGSCHCLGSIGMSRSGSHISSLNFLLFLVEVSCLGCLLGGTLTVLLTGLSSNLVVLACLLGWTLRFGTVSETKT